MDLREGNAILIRPGVSIENKMLLKSDLSTVFDLLIPGQPVSMRIDARDNIIQTVSIHIIDQHLRATLTAAKLEWVMFPDRIASQRLRLLPPAILVQNVGPA